MAKKLLKHLQEQAEALAPREPLKLDPAEVRAEEARLNPDYDLQAGGKGMTLDEVADRYLPTLPFKIDRMESGAIHVPRDANRWYTRQEGLALLKLLADALK